LVFLCEREQDELEAELKPVLNLATEYLNHLLIASRVQRPQLDLCLMLVRIARNPGGEKTPQESTRPTPDIDRLRDIKALLDDATINGKQSALKTLVSEFLRYGHDNPLKCLGRFTDGTDIVALSLATLSDHPGLMSTQDACIYYHFPSVTRCAEGKCCSILHFLKPASPSR
jgi:hypothetical protein